MNGYEEYVTYAQAEALKELGFDWPCRYLATSEDAPDGQYWNFPTIYPVCNHECNDRSFTIPTQAVACRWLREEKWLSVESASNGVGTFGYSLTKLGNVRSTLIFAMKDAEYGNYELALSSGIDRALELLKGGEQ